MSSQLFPKFLGADSRASRNGFDLSKRDVFSTKVGMLNCAKRIHVMPGSEVSIDLRHILRTDNIQTAAFARFNTAYEFYKVNYNDIFSGYNQYVAQRDDKQLISTPDTAVLPSFNIHQFVQQILPFAMYDYITDHPFSLSNGYILRTNDDKEVTGLSHSSYCIRYADTFSRSVASDVIRNLDMMGYGNFLPRVTAMYQLVKNCLEWLILDGNPNDFDTLIGHGLSSGNRENEYVILRFFQVVERLYEVINNTSVEDFARPNVPYQFLVGRASGSTDDQYIYNEIFSSVVNEYVNLWVPCAYNKIFENHYRNPYYDFKFKILVTRGEESGGNVPNGSYEFDYVQLFNLDDFVEDYFDSPSNSPRLISIFATKLHMYPKDMFTGVLPSTQFGDVSVFTDDRSWLHLEVGSGSFIEYNPLYTGAGTNPLVGLGSGSSHQDATFRFDPALAISVLNQRRADALQRFNENMLRAGNRTKSIFRAHFGYEPKSEQGHEAYYLGSFDGSIDLNTVTSTAETENASLGEQASTGVGVVSGKKIHVTSDDFAVILGIFYISKPTEYDSYGLDRFNEILDKWDLPYSELQNISLRPLDRVRLNVGEDITAGTYDRVLGYLPAHIEYKTAVDEIHGEFYSNYPFADYQQNYEQNRINFRKGLFSNFVAPKNITEFADEVRFLYIQPDSADNIFFNVSTGQQDSDQFKINMQCDCFAVHPLSVIGLPY